MGRVEVGVLELLCYRATVLRLMHHIYRTLCRLSSHIAGPNVNRNEQNISAQSHLSGEEPVRLLPNYPVQTNARMTFACSFICCFKPSCFTFFPMAVSTMYTTVHLLA